MYYAVDYPKFSVIFLIRFREFLVSYNRICLFEFQRKFIHPLHNNNKAYKIQEQVHPLQEPMSTPALPSDLTSISCTFINHSQADQKQKFGTVYANNIIGHLIQSKDTFTLGGSNSLGSQKFYKSYNSLGQSKADGPLFRLENTRTMGFEQWPKLPIPKKVEKTYAWLKIKKIVQSKMQMKYFISPKQLIADKQLIYDCRKGYVKAWLLNKNKFMRLQIQDVSDKVELLMKGLKNKMGAVHEEYQFIRHNGMIDTTDVKKKQKGICIIRK